MEDTPWLRTAEQANELDGVHAEESEEEEIDENSEAAEESES
jgi:hypothetical protein